MKKPSATERSFLILCIVLGVVQAWIGRYAMNSDGVSYLDIADAYFRRDWTAAINAYWSPMYSWFLGLALYLLRPSLWWEFTVVHLVNFVIYVFALFSFRFLIHSVVQANENSAAASSNFIPLPEDALLAVGYALFLWCSLVLIDLGKVTPDLLIAALVFLIGGYLLELRVHHSYWKFAMFGALNGAAYLSKGVMFPLGFGFLAILLFSGKISRARIAGVLLSAVVFLFVCFPFIYALTKAKGRFTYGDTGRLAYAAMVNPSTPQIHWQGEPSGSGTPRHPTRKLMEDPPVFEFGEPVRGTYPPWDDPSYWNEGLQWHFRLRSQLRVLIESAFAYEKLLVGESGIIAGAFILLWFGGKPAGAAIMANWPLMAVATLGLAAYSLVLVLPRYIAASMVVLWVAIFAGVRLPGNSETDGSTIKREAVAKYVCAAVAFTILLSVAGHLAGTAYTDLTVGAEASSKDQVKAAEGLVSLGLQPGDKVAVVGYGLINHWARLGRLRIVAEVAPENPTREFWNSFPARRNAAYERLKAAGAKAVIAWDPPASAIGPEWKQVSDGHYYAYLFSK
jgi:hypothetical protein